MVSMVTNVTIVTKATTVLMVSIVTNVTIVTKATSPARLKKRQCACASQVIFPSPRSSSLHNPRFGLLLSSCLLLKSV
jgi:hypothetical protein